MSYHSLYSHFSSASLHVPRNEIRNRVLAVTGINRVREIISGMDTATCRGLYLSPRNTSHQLAKQFGGHIIVMARGLNRCWYRFVFVKELMHMLDSPDEAADNAATFDLLLTELSGHGSLEKSNAYYSEMKAFWMALGLLCPEGVRQQIKGDKAAGASDYSLAYRLKIPELYVRHIINPLFEDEILPFLLK